MVLFHSATLSVSLMAAIRSAGGASTTALHLYIFLPFPFLVLSTMSPVFLSFFSSFHPVVDSAILIASSQASLACFMNSASDIVFFCSSYSSTALWCSQSETELEAPEQPSLHSPC